MDPKRLVKISKYLSKHLRHEPERLGLTLAPGGWVEVETLLGACASAHFPLTREELSEVVAKNDKQRFSFDDSGRRIRANQGHSTDVDLQLEAVAPPAVLYHGTAARQVTAILDSGLNKMARHHVHLSATVATAITVGSRHGKPVVLEVDAGAMARDGVPFYRSANGVWLVDEVPPRYLRVLL
jgi:putative RNA 2'-phosphotransferase